MYEIFVKTAPTNHQKSSQNKATENPGIRKCNANNSITRKKGDARQMH